MKREWRGAFRSFEVNSIGWETVVTRSYNVIGNIRVEGSAVTDVLR